GTTEVVLDVPGSTAEVLAFYQRSAADQGWTQPAYSQPGPGGGGGFQQAPTQSTASFCQEGASTPALTLRILPRRQGTNDVRLSLGSVGPPCMLPTPPSI